MSRKRGTERGSKRRGMVEEKDVKKNGNDPKEMKAFEIMQKNLK